jgi:hypothetical protein
LREHFESWRNIEQVSNPVLDLIAMAYAAFRAYLLKQVAKFCAMSLVNQGLHNRKALGREALSYLLVVSRVHRFTLAQRDTY